MWPKEAGHAKKRANVKNEEQYEALKDKGMAEERAARIANSPDASKKGSSRSSSKQGGITAQERVGKPPRANDLRNPGAPSESGREKGYA